MVKKRKQLTQKQRDAARSWMSYAEERAKDKKRPMSNMEARALQEKIGSFYD